jgi:hypothetical protein
MLVFIDRISMDVGCFAPGILRLVSRNQHKLFSKNKRRVISSQTSKNKIKLQLIFFMGSTSDSWKDSNKTFFSKTTKGQICIGKI